MLTRRRFLHLVGAATAAAACSRSPATSSSTSTQAAPAATTTLPDLSTDLPFSVWEEVIAALRTSPDHLPARASRLVSEADPEAIFSFVRDEIRLLPPDPGGFAKAVTGRLWGTRGTLRCGAGTPRDCADLLAELYARAGFEARVVEGDLTDPVDPSAIMDRSIERLFEPVIDQGTYDRWYQALGIIEAAEHLDLDQGDADSRSLADDIMGFLPGGLSPDDPFDPEPIVRVPLVEVTVDGIVLYANAIVPGAVFGQPYVERPTQALVGSRPGDVEVELAVSRTSDPSNLIPVAAATWPLEEVIGRQIVARFVPAGDLAAVLLTPPERLTTFIPVVGVQGPHLDREQSLELGVVGDPISVFGDVLAEVDGLPVVNGASTVGGDPNAAGRMANLTLSASALSFPEIRLRLGATDNAGQPVWDLPASALRVDEDGGETGFLLTATHPPNPKIVLLFDGSTSIPEAFDDEGVTTFAGELARRVLAEYPTASFRLGGVLVGTPSLSPRWISTVDEVVSEAGRVATDGSELWSALAGTRRSEANLIVLVTDAQATDSPEQTTESRPWVASGPPVVVVGVGEVDQAKAQDLADTSGGVAVPVADPAQAVEAVFGFLTPRGEAPYRLQYRADLEGDQVRTVTVRVGTIAVEAQYEVPVAADRLAPPALAGIYLTIGYGSSRVTRTLAGIPSTGATISSAVPVSLAEEVREALLGTAMISVEADAPLLSVWADDFLTAKLSVRPLWNAPASDLEAQVDAMATGIHHVPAASYALHPALPMPGLVYPRGPRFLMLAGRHLPDTGFVSRSDLLPLTGFSSTSPGVVGFEATLSATARLAVVERDLFEDSTALRLESRSLEYLGPSSPAPRDGPAAPFARVLDEYISYHRLYPADDEPFAFWAIDQQGSLLGILPDGSGGGSTHLVEAQCRIVSQVAAALQLAGGALGWSYAVLVSLGKTVALQYLRAAVVVATLDVAEVPDACNKTAKDLACDIVKDTLSHYVKFYEKVDQVDDTVEMFGGSFISCFG